jgi:hypothetical protein
MLSGLKIILLASGNGADSWLSLKKSALPGLTVLPIVHILSAMTDEGDKRRYRKMFHSAGSMSPEGTPSIRVRVRYRQK